jgi:hypothetical protein
MTFFHVSNHFAFFCTLMIYGDFLNAQAELDVFPSGASTAGCSSTWESERA